MTHTEFSQEMPLFLQTLKSERNVSTHTARAYASDLEHLSLFWHDVMQREQQDFSLKVMLERYINALYHKKISKSSIARKMSCFKSFERYMKRAHALELSLVFARPRVEKKSPTILTLDEVFFVLDRAHITTEHTQFPHRDRAILELLYATGIRCSELVNIQLQDIDPLKQTIRITKKGRKERFVSFGSECKKKIDLYITHERIKPQSDNEFLFLNYKNEMLTTRSIQRICALFSEFLDTKKQITPQVLRHSCALHLIQQGVDLKNVQEILGHENLTSTEQYMQLLTKNIQML